MSETSVIIPIAGGKGGVGKTLLTANLAIALAELGHSTVAVDLDLGNSNLHSLLGLPNKYPGIGDYLRTEAFSFEQLLLPTEFPHLRFLPGDGRMPFMANITHSQKLHLLSKLREIPAQYVLLDLGAGCAYNTLDFFGIAERGIVVSTPEYPAIMSALVFLKNFLTRRIDRTLGKNPEIAELLEELYVQPMGEAQLTVRVFKEKVAAFDPGAARQLEDICSRFRPRFVFNMGEHPDELKVLKQIDQTVGDMLSLEVEHYGFVFADPSVKESIRKKTAFIPFKRESRAAENIAHIARRIVRFWNTPIPNSAELLIQHTYRLREKSKGSAS